VTVKSGERFRSQVCSTEVIVIRAAEVSLTCGGHPLIALEQSPDLALDIAPWLASGSTIGKRYTDVNQVLEILVTRSGQGTLADGTTPLVLKSSKPLPASD
jgi:hypothetical protein